MSQDDLIDDAAEQIIAQASVLGQRCRVPAEAAALMVLRLAYAKSIADAVLFRGSDDPARLNVAIDELRLSLGDQVRLQVVIRKGLPHG